MEVGLTFTISVGALFTAFNFGYKLYKYWKGTILNKDKMLRVAGKRISKIAKAKVEEKIRQLVDSGNMKELMSWITEFEERFLKNENPK